MIELRPYQIDAIEQMRDRIKAGRVAPLCVSPTGSGKTVMQGTIVQKHLDIDPRHKVLVVAHRRELIGQMARTLVRMGITDIGEILPGTIQRPSARVQIASIQTLLARGVYPPGITLIVFDECVTGDTEVGGKRADEIKVGDEVESWNGQTVVKRRVTHVFVNKASSLLVLRIGGKSLACTGAHPIWVKGKGFINANEVQAGDMCCVRRQDTKDAGQIGASPNVLPRMLESDALAHDDKNEPCARLGKNEGTQSDAEGISALEGVEDASHDWASSSGTWREWEADAGTSEAFADFAGREVDFGGFRSESSDPTEVGYRHSEHGREAGNRGGRVEPCISEGSSEGQREGCLFEFARVDSIEVLECGSDGSFGGRAPESTVYNFEVEGEHNFFANGILTHNCHHYSADEWHEITKFYPGVIRVGFTATPMRSDGRGMSPAFDSLVVVSTIKELTALGYLVPCKVIAPNDPLPKPKLAQSPVDAYLAHARGQRTVVFADFIVNVEKFVAEFRDKGVHAVAVHGQMSDDERKRNLREHANGAVLVNCMVLTEGWDSPETAVCILARGCGNVGTYLQIVGRVLRPAPGKTHAVLIDLTGRSFYDHGHPDEDRLYSLTGKGIRGKNEEGNDINCPVCGQPVEPAPNSWPCPVCDYTQPGQVTEPRYTGDELAERYAIKRTEDNERRSETLARWITEARARLQKGNHLWAAVAKYKAVYGSNPTAEVRLAAESLSKTMACVMCTECGIATAKTYRGGKCGKCAFNKPKEKTSA